MIANTRWLFTAMCLIFIFEANSQNADSAYGERYRPQIHFSPKKGWMNDPNGMVYFNGKYHLFFQHNPDSTVWGPMHWGHAISTDLVHWKELPIALYPDALGTIFSGSAVIDKNNTAGFGANAMIAIFTSHNHTMEKEGFEKVETQSIAYSLDEGNTWTKHKGNPVLPNPGIRDFRDPKVTWHEPTQKWIMTLATKDHITFYSSADLKNWSEESKFGKNSGAHGGVWECPDLFPLNYEGKEIWVLIVNIGSGGPNGGSATQYFTGHFDGHHFTANDAETKWLDYGPDDYAGITWSNTGDKKIFIGWMSNWAYANVVPTVNWRSANTFARELAIKKAGEKYFVSSVPVAEINLLKAASYNAKKIKAGNINITSKAGKMNGAAILNLITDHLKSFRITLSNNAGEKLLLGYNEKTDQYYIDRSRSGNIAFAKNFGQKITAPRLTTDNNADLTLIIDAASVELFADKGLSVLTAIFFPTSHYTHITLTSDDGILINQLNFTHLNSIWK